ncbi:MAG: hypothetical protein M0021_03870 [Clostridia bacterium]|nr:hypothetical protein [Clostridia bacterium]
MTDVLTSVAEKCPDYEAITAAQGYGISLLGNVEATVHPRCDWCINWHGGSCEIYCGFGDKP